MVGKNKTGQIVLNIIFILLCTAAVAPFLLLLSSSLTDEALILCPEKSFRGAVSLPSSYFLPCCLTAAWYLPI